MSEHTGERWNYAHTEYMGVKTFYVFVDGGVAQIAAVSQQPEAEANARLIAAAPEMLEELHEWHTNLVENGYCAKASQVAAIIAEAKGETP